MAVFRRYVSKFHEEAITKTITAPIEVRRILLQISETKPKNLDVNNWRRMMKNENSGGGGGGGGEKNISSGEGLSKRESFYLFFSGNGIEIARHPFERMAEYVYEETIFPIFDFLFGKSRNSVYFSLEAPFPSLLPSSSLSDYLLFLLGGIVSSSFVLLFVYPFDVGKTMMIVEPGKYKSLFDVISQKGPLLYSGFFAAVLCSFPFRLSSCFLYACLARLQKRFPRYATPVYGMILQQGILIGATISSYPLETISRHQQITNVSFFEATRHIYSNCGFRGFFGGVAYSTLGCLVSSLALFAFRSFVFKREYPVFPLMLLTLFPLLL